MFDTKYLVTLPVGSMQQGDSCKALRQLPLSCTVMQWFLPGRSFSMVHLEAALKGLAAHVPNGFIELKSKGPALFGPNNDVPVHVLEENQDLKMLHTGLLAYLARSGNMPEELRWAGAGYRAHVTDTPMKAFLPGEVYQARRMALLGRREDGARKVLRVFSLGKYIT